MKHLRLFLLILVVVLAFLYATCSRVSSLAPSFGVSRSVSFPNTAVCVQSLREVGQWCFFYVDCEEVVDTTISRFPFSARVASIYYGRVPLGIDFSSLSQSSISVVADTVFVSLPDVDILDCDFVDESRTLVFHQEGDIPSSVLDSMLSSARRQMAGRALSADNLGSASDNARQSVSSFFSSLGFSCVVFR